MRQVGAGACRFSIEFMLGQEKGSQDGAEGMQVGAGTGRIGHGLGSRHRFRQQAGRFVNVAGRFKQAGIAGQKILGIGKRYKGRAGGLWQRADMQRHD